MTTIEDRIFALGEAGREELERRMKQTDRAKLEQDLKYIFVKALDGYGCSENQKDYERFYSMTQAYCHSCGCPIGTLEGGCRCPSCAQPMTTTT